MSQDRDLVEEERQAKLAASADDRTRPSRSGGGMDAGTKKLAIVAGGLGALLVLMVGGWSLLGHRPSGIPILSPPAGPVRVKPADPGGMQLMGAQVAPPTGNTTAESLAPGPEAAAPQALQAEVDRARQADQAAAPPASASPAPSTGVPPGSASHATPAPVPAPSAPEASTSPVQRPAAPSEPSSSRASPDDEDATPAKHPAPAASGQHVVQLAALESEAAARAEWARLSHKAPALFSGHTPVIASVARDGKQFFRLRTGGFGTIASATEFCARAKQAGIACTLADF